MVKIDFMEMYMIGCKNVLQKPIIRRRPLFIKLLNSLILSVWHGICSAINEVEAVDLR